MLDSTWDEGVSVGAAAKKVQVVILGTGEAWMQHAIAAMGNSFRGRAAGTCASSQKHCLGRMILKSHPDVETLSYRHCLGKGYSLGLLGQGLLEWMSLIRRSVVPKKGFVVV